MAFQRADRLKVRTRHPGISREKSAPLPTAESDLQLRRGAGARKKFSSVGQARIDKRASHSLANEHGILKTQELPKHPEKPKCIVREVAATQVSQGARRRLSANWVQIQDSWKAHRDNHGPDPAEFFALQFEETTEISRIAPPSKKRRLRNTNHLDVVLKRARNETDHRKFSARGSVKAREMHSPEHNKSRGGVVVASLEEIQIWAQTAEIDSFLHLGTEQEGKALKYQPP
ncbi:hypothetical protein DFH09DRAFT_1097500 [Mycena vulgaris]|nr:hypothetical protein DFH09DRAFT_1097500 [Mycena vulgaris]